MITLLTTALLLALGPADAPTLVRSAASGRWSEPKTWENGRPPAGGDRVQVRDGHVVIYDVLGTDDKPVRSIHIAGTLRFDPDRDTRLTVGLIKIQAGEDASESGFDCEAHMAEPDPTRDRPALEVGTPSRPVTRGHRAEIRLAAVEGLDPEECPAIVCCGGRMEFHGAAMSRTWVKLGAGVNAGESVVTLAEPVTGWGVGDRLIVTATTRQVVAEGEEPPTVREVGKTEERLIRAIEGTRVTLDAALTYAHTARTVYVGEVANLSRNVVVESADPSVARGHTMYHRHSAGSISYAEFRRLGKPGKLGKYSLHFHRVGDTMRGSSVVGASIWESGNRWVTIHGTNRLVLRDCVGYRSLGHGFFLEDGTEVDNIFDGNLAVQALATKPLPGQILGFDRNDGAGFWWANSRNAFMRNVAVECERYGFRYDAPESRDFDPVLAVRAADGTRRPVDIRTLPFLRFDGNEAHSQRYYGVNLGGPDEDGAGSVGKVGPDDKHPFTIRDLKVWDTRWAFEPSAPGVLVDGLRLAYSEFGFWRPKYDRHAYRGVNVHLVRWDYYIESGSRPKESDYPSPLRPADDRPPVSVITGIFPTEHGSRRLRVVGVAADDTAVRHVTVNGVEARALVPDFSRWEAVVERPAPAGPGLSSVAKDDAGNREPTPHVMAIR